VTCLTTAIVVLPAVLVRLERRRRPPRQESTPEIAVAARKSRPVLDTTGMGG
jgi:hypothetical protein